MVLEGTLDAVFCDSKPPCSVCCACACACGWPPCAVLEASEMPPGETLYAEPPVGAEGGERPLLRRLLDTQLLSPSLAVLRACMHRCWRCVC